MYIYKKGFFNKKNRPWLLLVIVLTSLGALFCGPPAADSSAKTPDTTIPTVNSIYPAGSATAVDITTIVAIVFSESMKAGTINGSNITVYEVGALKTAVSGAVSYISATNTAIFTPSANLTPFTTYQIIIRNGIQDASGNSLDTTYISYFLTGSAADVTSPQVTGNTPAHLDAAVVQNLADITAVFDEDVIGETISVQVLENGSGLLIPGTVSYNSALTQMTYSLSSSLKYSTRYDVSITGAQDKSGNVMTAHSFYFIIENDAVNPQVVSVSPPSNSTGVGTKASIKVVFSEPMDSATINNLTLTVDPGSGPIAGTIVYNSAENSATFKPSSPLTASTLYTASALTGIKDPAANALTASTVWSFTTGTDADSNAPSVTGTDPVDLSNSIIVSATINITMSEDIDATTLTSSNVLVKDKCGTLVSGVITFNSGTNTIVFTPDVSLKANTTYEVTVKGGFTGIADTSGNVMTNDYIFSFLTASALETKTITVNWNANREAIVNKAGGGYYVYWDTVSGFSVPSINVKRVDYVSGLTSPTSTTLSLDPGVYYIKVTGFGLITGAGEVASRPSTETSICVP